MARFLKKRKKEDLLTGQGTGVMEKINALKRGIDYLRKSIFWAVMIAVPGGLVLFFKRKRWL